MEEEFRMWDYSRHRYNPIEIANVKTRIQKIKNKLTSLGAHEPEWPFAFEKYFI